MRFLMALLFITAGLAGCASEPVATEDAAIQSTEEPFVPHVVIAVIDTGINPYHAEWVEQYDTRDPAEYIPGYPSDVEVLRLSEWDEAGRSNRASADADLWAETQDGVLYRYEGTKIVGHISFGAAMPGSGHGTMTASRATGNTISIGGPAVRLVVVQGFNHDALEWVAAQDWIDMVSISSGLSIGGLAPGAATAIDQASIDKFQEVAHKKPFFASSGNGVGNAGMIGFPTWLRGASGAPDVISVGANDNGDLSIWHNYQPYIVGDGCRNPSARDNTADNIANTGGGTSSATPFSAGGGAALLLKARELLGDDHVGVRYADSPIASFHEWDSLSPADASIILAQGDGTAFAEGPLADGIFTAQEFKTVLYKTALADGTLDDSDGDQCSIDASTAIDDGLLSREHRAFFQGYGEVNAKSIEHAMDVLATGNVPDRLVEDRAYEQAHLLRSTTDQ